MMSLVPLVQPVVFNLVWCPFHWLRNSPPSFPLRDLEHAASWLLQRSYSWSEVGYLTNCRQSETLSLPSNPTVGSSTGRTQDPVQRAQWIMTSSVSQPQQLTPSQTSFVASLWLWSQLLLIFEAPFSNTPSAAKSSPTSFQ